MFLKNIKSIVVLGVPLFAGSFTNYLLQLADTIMVGRLGTEQLAAIAIAGMLTGIFFVLVWPIAVGTQAIASRRFGKQTLNSGLITGTGAVLIPSFIVALVFGFVSFFVSLFSRNLLGILLKDKKLVEFALSYIRILRWVLPVVGLYASVRGFLAAINKTGVIMIATLGSNIVNIFLDYILIFGKFGFPAMGIRGAALGTILAQSLGFIYLIVYMLLSPAIRKYGWMRAKRIDMNIIRGIVKSSVPVMIQNFVALFIFLIYESVIGNIGTVFLAATHIVFSVFRINKTIVSGFAQGGSILVGNSLGRNERDRAVGYSAACEFIAFVIGILVVLSAALIPGFIVKLFNQNPATIITGIRALKFFALFFFVEIMGYSFEIIFTHNGWGRFVLFSEITTDVIFILGVTLLLIKVFNLGIYGAWTGFALYQVFHASILTAGFFSKRWLDIRVEHE